MAFHAFVSLCVFEKQGGKAEHLMQARYNVPNHCIFVSLFLSFLYHGSTTRKQNLCFRQECCGEDVFPFFHMFFLCFIQLSSLLKKGRIFHFPDSARLKNKMFVLGAGFWALLSKTWAINISSPFFFLSQWNGLGPKKTQTELRQQEKWTKCIAKLWWRWPKIRVQPVLIVVVLVLLLFGGAFKTLLWRRPCGQHGSSGRVGG